MFSSEEVKRANVDLPENVVPDTQSSTFFPGTTRDTKNKFTIVASGEIPSFYYRGNNLSVGEAYAEIKKLRSQYRVLTIDVYQRESSSYCGSFDIETSSVKSEAQLVDSFLDLLDLHDDQQTNKTRGYPVTDQEGHVHIVLNPSPDLSFFVPVSE